MAWSTRLFGASRDTATNRTSAAAHPLHRQLRQGLDIHPVVQDGNPPDPMPQQRLRVDSDGTQNGTPRYNHGTQRSCAGPSRFIGHP
jgi:hypothetical protein